ncbi:MAG TPA: hypothetical protein VFJ85_18865 [Acidimicrobiales bacterium]|nr:hypothetical protein [Acidimicrobiales bacterium]
MNLRRATGVRLGAALVVAVAAVAAWASPAWAGVGLGVTPIFPPAVAVGSSGVGAQLRIVNQAAGDDVNDSATLTDITLAPSCGKAPAAPPDLDCTGAVDPTLTLNGSGTGAAGTACAGRSFTIALIDPTIGRYRFSSDQTIVLGPPSDTDSDTCLIDFTFNVPKMPSKDAFPNKPDVQTTQLAYSAASFPQSELTGSGTGTDVTTITRATPALTTRAPASSTIGQPTADVATLAGGVSPTGTITFTLYGPNDQNCSGTPMFTSTKQVAGNGDVTSDSFTPTAAGTYRWVAAYSGDSNNVPVTAACGAANEVTEVAKVTPTVNTKATPSLTLGKSAADVATLSGGTNPTGTLTFTLYGPGDETCTGTPVFTSSKTVTGNGDYTSESFTPTKVGTYRWLASYSGDANNASVAAGCGAANEVTKVVEVTPELSTHAPPTSSVGQPVADVATLSGGSSPTGTITFTLYGPDDTTCTGTPAFTSSKPVTGNGDVTSDSFTPTAGGTYRWVATYSGDDRNAAVTAACGAANEITQVAAVLGVTVTTAAPQVSGEALPVTGSSMGGLTAFAALVVAVGLALVVGSRWLVRRRAAGHDDLVG